MTTDPAIYAAELIQQVIKAAAPEDRHVLISCLVGAAISTAVILHGKDAALALVGRLAVKIDEDQT